MANFQAINTVWSANHNSLIGTDTQGQHRVLTMRAQASDPTTASNQIAIYNKLVSSIPELFFAPKSSGTPIQLTYPTISAGSGDTQQSFLAGPFVVYSGIVRGGITNGQQITVSPASTLIYANVTAYGVTALANARPTVVATSLNSPANTFTVNFFPSGGTTVPIIYYLAIGKP